MEVPQFLSVPLQAGDAVLREVENGVILMRVCRDDDGNLVVVETVFEDHQPILRRRIEVEANPRIMSMGEALKNLARDVLATSERLGLFLGLQTPEKKHPPHPLK